jgi:hypothetical protein
MNRILGLKILSAAACVAWMGGCFPAETEPAPEVLEKTSASEYNGCPKYTNFITTFATEIQTCAMDADEFDDCAPEIVDAFEPILTCLDIPVPDDVNSAQDLYDMSSAIGEKVEDFDNDESKAVDFINCLCGTSYPGASRDTTDDLEASTYGGFSTSTSTGSSATGGGFSVGTAGSSATGGGFSSSTAGSSVSGGGFSSSTTGSSVTGGGFSD